MNSIRGKINNLMLCLRSLEKGLLKLARLKYIYVYIHKKKLKKLYIFSIFHFILIPKRVPNVHRFWYPT